MQRYDQRTALVVVDLQNDFADPAGGLSVAGGDAIVPTVNGELAMASSAGATPGASRMRSKSLPAFLKRSMLK